MNHTPCEIISQSVVILLKILIVMGNVEENCTNFKSCKVEENVMYLPFLFVWHGMAKAQISTFDLLARKEKTAFILENHAFIVISLIILEPSFLLYSFGSLLSVLIQACPWLTPVTDHRRSFDYPKFISIDAEVGTPSWHGAGA